MMACGRTSNRNVFEMRQSYEILILKNGDDKDDGGDNLAYIERKFKEIGKSQRKVVKTPNKMSISVFSYEGLLLNFREKNSIIKSKKHS